MSTGTAPLEAPAVPLAAAPPLRVAMVGPIREGCGVSDYTDALVDELREHVDVAVRVEPADFDAACNDVDLVHIQHEYHAFGGVAPWKCTVGDLMSRITRPVVMTVHEYVHPGGSPAMRAGLAISNRRHFRHRAIRAWLVHTEIDRQRMLQAGHADRSVRRIAHGVPRPPDLPDRQQARDRLGLGDRFVVTIPGYISRRKGHLAALEALAGLDEQVLLLIAGGKHPDDTTPYAKEVEARASAAGLSHRVRITGFLERGEWLAALAATDLVLSPATECSGSGSLTQAMACRKPVVATAIPAHQEICRDTPGALHLVEPGDPAALAEALRTLSSDRSARERLIEGAVRYAQSHSFARMAGEVVHVYHEILNEGWL